MRRHRNEPLLDPYWQQRESVQRESVQREPARQEGRAIGQVPVRRPPAPLQATSTVPDDDPAPLRKEAETLRGELKGLSARYVELKQDFDRYRERQRDAVADAAREAREQMLMELAEVADDLERSIASNPDRESAWYQGNLAILQRTLAILQKHGVERFGEVGEPFDPRMHEAVGAAPSSRWEDGTVIAVHQVGYRSSRGLLRPARVVVARNPQR